MHLRPFANAVLVVCLSSSCNWTHAQAASPNQAPQPMPAAVAIPQLPTPSGAYGVGRVGYDWTDPSRLDRFSNKDRDSSAPQPHRELMVYVWYPTSANAADAKGTYLPGAKKMDATPEIQRSMRDDYKANWPLIVSNVIYSHATDNAAIAKSPGKFPLVILSHGLGGSGFGYTALIEDMVSHGYVVAAIEHPESAGAVWFPDGRLIPFHQDAPPPNLSPEERWNRMMKSVSVGIEEGAADVRLVLDRLTDLNAGNPVSAFAGKLDLNRVAAMGHSAGAEFAARACELDARFKACVDLDGGMVPVAALPEFPDGATIKQPLLFLEAYHDEAHMGGTHAQHLEYFKKREEQLQKCPAGTYAVVLRSPGMVHGSFSDDPFLEAGGHAQNLNSARHNFDLITTFVRAFLDKTLDHNKGTLFDTHHPAIPEAEIVPYGH
jgi:dienelactone hydrolase